MQIKKKVILNEDLFFYTIQIRCCVNICFVSQRNNYNNMYMLLTDITVSKLK